MTVAKVTSKGQITIPKSVRTHLELSSGDKVNFIIDDQGFVQLAPITRHISSLKGIVPKPKHVVSIVDMNATIKTRGGQA